ncbi:MAG: DUF4926 domain-containing protein [Anaerolineae bacterium]|nr:DUF4926 domain-containing protein [Anaerolineae bacterium]
MKIDLYEQVALNQDLPDYGLRRGDVATLVEYVPHPKNGEEGCILEVFNAVGESIAVIVVPVSVIEPLRADEILRVRTLVP